MIDKKWYQYPMGPVLRHVLEIEESEYQGEKSARPSEEQKEAFEAALKPALQSVFPLSYDELTELIDELTSMGMPSLTLFLCDHHRDYDLSKDFKALLNLGAAAMLEAEFDDAIDLMKKAHEVEPKELAPYVNLAKILLHTYEDEEADRWAQAGLALDGNHRELWEVVAKVSVLKGDRESAHKHLIALARKIGSFAGLSLAGEIVSDPLLKAELLEERYQEGSREGLFLVEYTAALGEAGQFQKIPMVLWEAENMPHFSGAIPWQLYLHVIQAYLSLEDDPKALSVIAKLEGHKDLPANTKKELSMLKSSLLEGEQRESKST